MICSCSLCIRTNRFTAPSVATNQIGSEVLHNSLYTLSGRLYCHVVLLRWFLSSLNQWKWGTHDKVHVCTLWKYQLFRPIHGFLSPLIAPQSSFLLNYKLLWLKMHGKCDNTSQRHLQNACTHSSLGMHCNLACFWYKRPAWLMGSSHLLIHMFK